MNNQPQVNMSQIGIGIDHLMPIILIFQALVVIELFLQLKGFLPKIWTRNIALTFPITHVVFCVVALEGPANFLANASSVSESSLVGTGLFLLLWESGLICAIIFFRDFGFSDKNRQRFRFLDFSLRQKNKGLKK